MGSEMRPMSEAPKDDEILLSFWRDEPVFIGWFPEQRYARKRYQGFWPFGKTVTETEIDGEGWRVLSWSPRLGWGICGNCAPFTPKGWWPLPPSPTGAKDNG